MAKVETLKCPECGGPLHFEKDQEYCFCSHCGHQVYKEDVHYDRRLDFEEHKIDANKELELAKIKKDETEIKIGIIAVIVMLIIVFLMMALLY